MTKTELVDALGAMAHAMPAEEGGESPLETGQDAVGRANLTSEAPTVLESVVDAKPPAKPAAAVEPAPATAQGATIDAPQPPETALESETEPASADAATVVKPEPQFKKTWTRHELLIDDQLPELPETYGEDKLITLVRDPFWIHAYWDLAPATLARAHAEGGQRMVLRVHDVTDLIFDGRNAHHWFEIPVAEYVRNWNINVPSDGRNYLVELGWVTGEGRFLSVMRSTIADVPIGRPSPIIADKFVSLPFKPAPEAPATAEEAEEAVLEPVDVIPTEDLAPPAPATPAEPNLPLPDTMYHLSTQGRGYWSADTPRYGDLTWDALESSMGSHRMGSHGVSSVAAPPPPPAAGQAKDFWLVANCELIVYGATEPDATVTLRGQNIELRPDGTFSIRFAFPDGLHPIPIHAVNADGDMERSITITVSRDTQA